MRTRTANSAIINSRAVIPTLAWPTPLCACENRIISSVFSNNFKDRVNRFVFVYSSNLAPCCYRVNAFFDTVFSAQQPCLSPAMPKTRAALLSSTTTVHWRPRRESNPHTWICNPLRSHSATRPISLTD